MRSGKSEIKSKKTKLLEKKQDKNKGLPRLIEIQSSEDERTDLQIEKRRTTTTKVNDAPQKYNNFNIEKLKKVDCDPKKVENQLRILVVEENDKENPMQHTEARALFAYRIEGNESTKYVSDLYLEQRVKKMAEDELAKVASAIEEKKGEAKLEEDNEDAKEEKEERKRAGRYFQSLIEDDNQNRLIKCFRCGQKGHIAKNCLEEKLQAKCLFCMQDHHHHDCNSRACFRCNQIGHIAQECRATGIQCRKCGKKGHLEKGCGAIVFLDYSRIKSDSQFREKYHGSDLKQLRCMTGCLDPNGHFNCHKYHQFHKSLPYESFMRYNDHPQTNFKNSSSSKHQFIDYERQLEEFRPSSSGKSKSRKHSYTGENDRLREERNGGNWGNGGSWRSGGGDRRGGNWGHVVQNWRTGGGDRGNWGNGGNGDSWRNGGNHRQRYDHRAQRW